MRNGEDHYHPPVRGTGETVHNIANVYGEMLRQVLRDYSGLPPFVDLEMSDILSLIHI